MWRLYLVALLCGCMFMGSGGRVLGDTVRGIDIEFVTIGHAGNPGDTRPEGYPPGTGAVGYEYRIGKYEVTNAQWNAFASAAGQPTGFPGQAYDQEATWAGLQQPVNGVSWYEAAQFCNWLTTGDKSLGAYQLGPDGSITVNRDAALVTYGIVFALPTEDEWYKAAYFKADGSGYSTYANGQESIPPADNGWNYYGGAYSSPWNVGTGTMEQNGTFDMMGNVWEWNETRLEWPPDFDPEIGMPSGEWDSSWAERASRGWRGGSYSIVYLGDNPISMSSSDISQGLYPIREASYLGFRIVSIPEPATLLLLGLGGLGLLRRRG